MTTRVSNRMIDGAAVNILDFGAVDGAVIDDALDAAIDYINTKRQGDLHSPLLVGEPGAVYELRRAHDITNVSIDFSTSTLKVGDAFPDESVLFATDTSTTKGWTFKVNFNGNKAGNAGNVICAKLQGITSPTNTIEVQGHDARTLCQVLGNTETSVIKIKGIDCDILFHEKEATGGGDVTPDENIYELSGKVCKTYYKRENSNSTSIVRLNAEQQNEADNLYAIDIQGGGKSVSLSGVLRAPRNAMLFDSASHLDFDNFTIFAPRGDGPRINQCLSISGTLHVNADASVGTTALGLILRRATNGGSLTYNQIGKSDTPSYTVRLGNESDGVSCDDVLLNLTGLECSLDLNFAKRCGITARRLESLRIGVVSESNDIELGSNFIINDKTISNLASDYLNTVRSVGSVSTTQLSNYTTPIAGMRVQSVRGAGEGREALYISGSWQYATYS